MEISSLPFVSPAISTLSALITVMMLDFGESIDSAIFCTLCWILSLMLALAAVKQLNPIQESLTNAHGDVLITCANLIR